MGKDGHLTVLEEGIGTDVRAHGGADHHLALRGFCEPLTLWFSAIYLICLPLCLDLPWAFHLQVTLQGLFELKNPITLCLELRVVLTL